eukprot:15118770-Heterocapsa_arctica.AAC.1
MEMNQQQTECEGDYEENKGKRENHKIHHKIMLKEEKEGGTLVTSINLSGSQTDFEYMLDHCKDHIMLIQEHWRLKYEIEKWKSTAYLKGWQGVWEPAM